jgi:hypothetical protein
MKKAIYIVAAIFFLQLNMAAQSKSKPKFSGITQAGFLAGGSTNSLQLQTINGIGYRGFSLGIGAGIDYYYLKTIPLFADVRKDIFAKKKTPFVYFDMGTDLPWNKTETEDAWQKSQYKNGLFYDFGIGYKWLLKERLGLNFSLGYSQKKLRETRETIYWMWRDFPPYGPSTESGKDTTDYKYSLQRISFKIGLSF